MYDKLICKVATLTEIVLRQSTSYIGCDSPKGSTYPECNECYAKGEPGEIYVAQHKDGCYIAEAIK